LLQKSGAEIRFSISSTSCGECEASKIPPEVHRALSEIVVPPHQVVEH
jgi:hypothetical protein